MEQSKRCHACDQLTSEYRIAVGCSYNSDTGSFEDFEDAFCLECIEAMNAESSLNDIMAVHVPEVWQ